MRPILSRYNPKEGLLALSKNVSCSFGDVTQLVRG
jgi:hypothetical protein